MRWFLKPARWSAFAVLCLVVLQYAYPHRQPISWSDVELSSDQRQAQITHRLHIHDAVKWLHSQGRLQPNLDDLKQRALIALYAANNTQFWQQDKSPIAVQVIGAETQGDYLFIYLQSEIASRQITHLHTSILMALNPLQRNRVNVLSENAQTSFVFSAKTPPQAITAVVRQ